MLMRNSLRRAEQVGKLKVFVAQPVARKVADKVLTGYVRDDAFVSLYAHELDVVKNGLKRLVRLRQGDDRFIESTAESLVGVVQVVLQIRPARLLGNEEVVVVIRVVG